MTNAMRTCASLAAICVSITLARAEEPNGGRLSEPIEERGLYAAWRNMANEQIAYPLAMKNMPVKIGAQRQLFVDNYLIADSDHVEREVHEPKRHPENPILSRRETQDNVFVLQVRRFETSPRFRMWYWSWRSWHTLPSGQDVRFATSYAHSEDGIHWELPELDQHQIEGLAHRNVVIPYGMMQGLFYEPDERDPNKRFKALVCVEGKNPTIHEGYYLHTSPDGIHWKADLSRYVIPSLTSYGMPQNGIGDTSRFWWDPIRGKYIGDAKFVLPGKFRCRGMMESDDLVHWSRPRPAFFARADGNQIYGHTAFAYEGMYIGTRWIYVPAFDTESHAMYVELDCSRDGVHWTRVGAGQPFMSFNPMRDTWDAAKMKPTTLMEVGNEIRIYYAAALPGANVKKPVLPASKPLPYSVGLATLPRDRFVSINAGSEGGQLLTRPLTFGGHTLHVNAEVAHDGQLRVAVLTRDGNDLEGYTSRDCAPLSGDGLDLPVTWSASTTIDGAESSGARLRFELKNAKLYSFWID